MVLCSSIVGDSFFLSVFACVEHLARYSRYCRSLKRLSTGINYRVYLFGSLVELTLYGNLAVPKLHYPYIFWFHFYWGLHRHFEVTRRSVLIEISIWILRKVNIIISCINNCLLFSHFIILHQYFWSFNHVCISTNDIIIYNEMIIILYRVTNHAFLC